MHVAARPSANEVRERTMLLFSLLISSVLFATSPASSPEGADVYTLAAKPAIEALPPLPRDYFRAQSEALELAAGSFGHDASAANAVTEAGRHFVMLDITASSDNPDVLAVAAREFPHESERAASIFRERGVDGGTLPWTAVERQKALIAAFRLQQVEDILRETAAILHLCTDASLPFHVTRLRDERRIELRRLMEEVLAARMKRRLHYEARVLPDRFAPAANSLDCIFEAALAAHRELSSIEEIDDQIRKELGIVNSHDLAAHMDAYYTLAAERLGPLLETEIERGSLLAARLIGTAWLEAGSPKLPPPLLLKARQTNAAQTLSGGPFVASTSSSTYHRATCKQASRIKEEKRVFFQTAAQARGSGRKPCRICKPE